MSSLPLLIPTFVVGIVAAFAVRRRLARTLRMPVWAAWLLVASTAVIVAVTLTPQREAAGAPDVFAALPVAEAPLGGAVWRWPWQWLLDDRTLNVAIFVPLGVAVAFVGRAGVRWLLVGALLVAPLAIEVTQYLVGWLARDSQWQDVVDNTTGALLGLGVGLLLRALLRPRPRVPAP